MVRISAFKSLRPNKKLVHQVPTNAYSTYSKEEIKKEIQKNKYSFLNIITTETNSSLEQKFKSIRSKLNEFQKREILIKDKHPGIYIYRQSTPKHVYTGLICAIELKEYQNRKIKIHEKTIEKREELFAKYLSITKIHAEPVLITYENTQNLINNNDISDKNKLYVFENKNGIKHEVWRIINSQKIKAIIKKFTSIQNLYIADGHHRMASSLKSKATERCLAYILPKKELTIYPFHRALSTNKSPKKILKEINSCFNIKEISLPNQQQNNIQFYVGHKWYEIQFAKQDKKDIVDNLLVSKLLNNILRPVFNIEDERANQNIRFISGNLPIKNIEKNIKNTEILFLMNTIEIDTIIQIAKNNKTTPPKSTFILPKIPSGLIMMELT